MIIVEVRKREVCKEVTFKYLLLTSLKSKYLPRVHEVFYVVCR